MAETSGTAGSCRKRGLDGDEDEKKCHPDEQAGEIKGSSAHEEDDYDSVSPEHTKTEWRSKRTVAISSSSSSFRVLISGRGYLTCLQGSVNVHGFTLTAHNDMDKQRCIPFDCPPSWSNWLTLLPCDYDSTDEIRIQIDSMDLRPSKQDQQQQKTLPASFTLHSFHDGGGKKNFRPTILPQLWEQTAINILEGFQHHSRAEAQSTQPTSQADGARNDLSSSRAGPLSRSLPLVVAICGAKGVGKSTFLRYLLNRLLSQDQHLSVSVLDADLGQPEFSPPGMVTLTTPITEPLLSPPHMHMVVNTAENNNPFLFSSHGPKTCARTMQSQHAFFLGGTSSSQCDTSAYMQSIEMLLRDYRRHSVRSNRDVLLVNLDGWVKGLGGELLQALLQQAIQPTHIVQIQGTTPSQQFDLPPHEGNKITVHVLPSYRHYYELKDTEEQVMPTADTSPLEPSNMESIPELERKSVPVVLRAAALRTLRLCTYFLDNDISLWERISVKQGEYRSGSCLNDLTLEIPERLAALPPYIVPVQAVSLVDPAHGSFATDDLQELYPWNASIVGLCCQNQREANAPWFLLPCVGLGLIRSIDVVQKLLYVLTPVDPKYLACVDVLVKTQHMGLPVEMTFRGVNSECFPYMQMNASPNEDVLLLGTAPIKSRNSIGRKRHQSNGNMKRVEG